MSTSCGPWLEGSRAGAAAAPPAVATGVGGAMSTAGVAGSGSRMSAPSPRPKAFLGIGNYLLGELRVALGPLAVYVIENNRLTETWRLGKAHVARNDTLKDLSAEETTQIGGYLARKRGALVVHREQNTFNFEAGIEGAANPHQRVE